LSNQKTVIIKYNLRMKNYLEIILLLCVKE
jgi:hypothetical protein